jgi:hypothetical protein
VRVLCVNPGPVPTEAQEVAGYESGHLPPVPGKISAERVAGVASRLRARPAHDHTRPSDPLVHAHNKPSPLSIKLRVTERMYRPAGRN